MTNADILSHVAVLLPLVSQSGQNIIYRPFTLCPVLITKCKHGYNYYIFSFASLNMPVLTVLFYHLNTKGTQEIQLFINYFLLSFILSIFKTEQKPFC